jgi:uncharacterized membrane protein YphA (DoxX/SURF4 family)
MNTLNYNLALSQVQRTLRITYGIVPIVAGLDKFTGLLVNWENYIHPGIVSMLPFSPHTFMMIVGVIEIIAGIIVLAKPAIGGFIVMAWLALIAITLLASGNYLDVAVRDLTMAIGALSLARLSKIITTQPA